MSDSIKHECGIALMRLLRPAEYYIDKYGSWDYSLRKMYLMMEKQHNRGQDGAGTGGDTHRREAGNAVHPPSALQLREPDQGGV
jgi:amidophosphoribosyltransferase